MMIDGPGFGGFWIAAVIVWVIWLAIIIGIVALIVLGVRWLLRAERRDRYQPPAASSPPAASAPPAADPLEVLRHRYARGEIDEEEYERRRKTLGGS